MSDNSDLEAIRTAARSAQEATYDLAEAARIMGIGDTQTRVEQTLDAALSRIEQVRAAIYHVRWNHESAGGCRQRLDADGRCSACGWDSNTRLYDRRE